MDPARWRKIETIYHAALDEPASRRNEFVRRACDGDSSLEPEVASLLAQTGESSQFLETPALEVAAKEVAFSAASAAASLPDSIGRYRILGLLGQGGMGTVYEAEQDHPRRVVALKIIPSGLVTPEILRRFEKESQALGRLQHPGIAQIYDAGAAVTGSGPQPYFAMERIHGELLDDFAKSHALDVRAKLVLMIKICDAVQHAHQRGLIHRDLKPGNILVDESGQPKILDFGVARMTEPGDQMTLLTDAGKLVGTLAYMSPEQVLGDSLEIDTRSDVYALGVILFQLLTSRLPYEISGRKLPEAAHMIQERDPPPLSATDRRYRGDLETIVNKALEKEKARRYASASDLGADLERYLNDEPIAARPATASYQLRKFARRNRGLVAGGAAAFVVLIAGIAASTWEAIQANRATSVAKVERDHASSAERAATQDRDRAVQAQLAASASENRAIEERNRAIAERQRADEEADTARALDAFLRNDLLAQAGLDAQARPGVKPDPDLKLRTALDRAAAAIPGKFDKQPLVEASIRQTIGDTYLQLGIYPQAQKQMERALELRRRNLGDDHDDTLGSMMSLATLLRAEGKNADSETLNLHVLEIERNKFGASDRKTLHALDELALLYRAEGQNARAEEITRQAYEIQRRTLGEENPDTLLSMSGLGALYIVEGKYQEAEAITARVLELRSKLLGEEHSDTQASLNNLAAIYDHLGKFVQAEALDLKLLEIRRRTLGENHPNTALALNNLASVYRNQGKYSQAEPLLKEALEIRRKVLGEDHRATLQNTNDLAATFRSEGKFDVAEPLLKVTLEARRRTLGAEHPDTLLSMNELGVLYRLQNQYAQAEEILGKTLDIERRVLGPRHPYTTNVAMQLAEVELLEKKYAQAKPHAREAMMNWEKTNPDHWRRFYCQTLIGESLAGQKEFEEAESLLVGGFREIVQRQQSIALDRERVLNDAARRVAELYENWNKPEKAAEWRAKIDAKIANPQ